MYFRKTQTPGVLTQSLGLQRCPVKYLTVGPYRQRMAHLRAVAVTASLMKASKQASRQAFSLHPTEWQRPFQKFFLQTSSEVSLARTEVPFLFQTLTTTVELPQLVSPPGINWKEGQSSLEDMAVWFLSQLGRLITKKAEQWSVARGNENKGGSVHQLASA